MCLLLALPVFNLVNLLSIFLVNLIHERNLMSNLYIKGAICTLDIQVFPTNSLYFFIIKFSIVFIVICLSFIKQNKLIYTTFSYCFIVSIVGVIFEILRIGFKINVSHYFISELDNYVLGAYFFAPFNFLPSFLFFIIGLGLAIKKKYLF